MNIQSAAKSGALFRFARAGETAAAHHNSAETENAHEKSRCAAQYVLTFEDRQGRAFLLQWV